MARDIYSNVMVWVGPDDVLSAFEDLQITVRKIPSGDPATIYRARTGAAQGPTVQTEAVGVNPFVTSDLGLAEFWAVQASTTSRSTICTLLPASLIVRSAGIGPAAVGGIPGDLISLDGRLPLA